MTLINWDKPFFIDPSTGETTTPLNPNAVAVPTYANYWGGNYAMGVIGGVAPTKPGGLPFTVAELLSNGNPADDPLDALDEGAYFHDVAWKFQTSYTLTGALADLAFMNYAVKLDASYDPGASLMAGLTTIGMAASITLHGFGSLLFSRPLKLVAAFTDAVHDIQYELNNLPPEELGDLDVFIHNFNAPSSLNEFAFDFAIKTTSFRQELVESVAMNTLNTIIDGGEADNVPLNTGFPFAGTSHYELAYNAITGDLDLNAA